jgi:hypothetical protein
MNNAEVAEARGKIAPRDARAAAVKHRLHKQPVILRGTTFRTLSSWKHPLNPFPLIVTQTISPNAHTKENSQQSARNI